MGKARMKGEETRREKRGWNDTGGEEGKGEEKEREGGERVYEEKRGFHMRAHTFLSENEPWQ